MVIVIYWFEKQCKTVCKVGLVGVCVSHHIKCLLFCLPLPKEKEQHSLKVLSHILSDFKGDRQLPVSLAWKIIAHFPVSHYNYCYFCLGAASGVKLGIGGSVSLEEVDKVGKGTVRL